MEYSGAISGIATLAPCQLSVAPWQGGKLTFATPCSGRSPEVDDPAESAGDSLCAAQHDDPTCFATPPEQMETIFGRMVQSRLPDWAWSEVETESFTESPSSAARVTCAVT